MIWRIGTLIGCIAATTALGQDARLAPLVEILPTASRDYPFIRCAALYGAGYEFALRDNMNIPRSEIDPFVEEIGFHLSMAHLQRRKPADVISGQLDAEIRADTSELQDRYAVVMRDNFLREGRHITGMVEQDLQVCRSMKENLVE